MPFFCFLPGSPRQGELDEILVALFSTSFVPCICLLDAQSVECVLAQSDVGFDSAHEVDTCIKARSSVIDQDGSHQFCKIWWRSYFALIARRPLYALPPLMAFLTCLIHVFQRLEGSSDWRWA